MDRVPIHKDRDVQPHSQLRAVVFDYGGVLSLLPAEQDWERLAKAINLPVSVLLPYYWEFREGYDRAIYGGATYWRRIAGTVGQDLDDEAITRLIALDNDQWGRENSAAIELAGRLRAAGVKIAVLSNMQFEMLARIRASFSWLQQFDAQLYSCELGISKPQAEIFLHAVKLLKVAPEQALFLDDRQVNLDGARRIGMRTMKYEAPHSHPALEQLLVASGVDVYACGEI